MAIQVKGSLFLGAALVGLASIPPCEGREATSLGEVVVAGEGATDSSGEKDLTIATTVIPMKRYRDRATTVGELLDQVAGVRVQRFGGLEDFATVAIRGSSSEQVEIYLDGIPLNQAAGGAVNLATIPIEAIAQITVYRGQAPARFATSAIGGVIAIETHQAKAKRQSELRQRYGSLNTYTGSVHHGGRFGRNRLVASYQYSRSDGDFTYHDDNGTPANPSDDQTARRQNNGFAKHNLLFRLGRNLSEQVDISLANNFFFEERGIPGLGTLKSETAGLTTTRNLTQLNVTLNRFAWQGLELTVAPFFGATKSQFADLNGEIGLGRQDNDDDTFLYGGDIRAVTPWGNRQRWTLLIGYRGEEFRPENRAAAVRTGTPGQRHRITLALEDEIYLWGERLVLTPLLRAEGVFNDLSGNDPSLTTLVTANSATQFPLSGKIGVRLALPVDLLFRANFGRAYRVPNFLELFGDRGATAGNPALDPERSWNYDVGLTWSVDRYRVAATYFESRTADLIQFLQTSQFTARATNLASATIRGIEFETEVTPVTFLTVAANYTWQWAKDTSGRTGFDGQFLPGRPQHQLGVSAIATHKWGRLFAALDFIDSNFLDTFNAREVNHRSLLGIGMSVTPWRWLTAGFEVKNLLGEQIEDAVGYPVPGRLYFGSLIVTI